MTVQLVIDGVASPGFSVVFTGPLAAGTVQHTNVGPVAVAQDQKIDVQVSTDAPAGNYRIAATVGIN